MQNRNSGQGNGGNQGRQGGGQGGGQQGEKFGGDVAVQEEARQETQEHEGYLSQLKELTQHLQNDRQMHMNAVAEIDEGLKELKRDLDEALDMAEGGEGGAQGQGGGQQGGQGGQGGRGQTRSRRGGHDTGTSIMMRILQENKGEMKSTELRDAAQSEGVSSPYSSLYSLQQRGMVERGEDGMVRLTQQAQQGGEEGGGGQSNRGGGNRGGSGQDRNNDGKGRGNFGNPEEHARAGSQSHKND
jgi:hypothetical protein